jgi:hypothetical protein
VPSKDGRVFGVHNLAVSNKHVDAARQARIEATNCSHNIDALEILRPVFFKYRRILHGVS